VKVYWGFTPIFEDIRWGSGGQRIGSAIPIYRRASGQKRIATNDRAIDIQPLYLYNAKYFLGLSSGGTIAQLEVPMNASLIKLPSAWVPIALSLAALALVLGSVAIFGVVHEADEGTGAHIFQLLLAAQVPIVAFFALKWLFRAPREALLVLALQVGAALAAMAPVYFLKL
jgi:hypothetical protein